MSFLQKVDKVIALLQSRGRISYRVLKREFELNDGDIEDLKDELIEAQELAVDKDGKVLVWVGKDSPASSVQCQKTRSLFFRRFGP
jgi:hypothetical protein